LIPNVSQHLSRVKKPKRKGMIIYLAILCALFGMVKSPVKMVVGDLQIGDQVGSRLESPGSFLASRFHHSGMRKSISNIHHPTLIDSFCS